MKRLFAFILVFSMFSAVCCGCGTSIGSDTDRLQIVATSFPPFDFARAVVGEYADVSLLIDPGTETHSYDPSPKDIRMIQECDIFIYGGGKSDTWIQSVDAIPSGDGPVILSMMDIVTPLREEVLEGMQTDDHEDEDEDDHDHAHDTYDEHVWTSPVNAILISEAICASVCEADTEHADVYRSKCAEYVSQLDELTASLRAAVKEGTRNTLVFADRFPFLYFVKEFDLNYYAAFPGCAENTEPGAQTVAFLIDKVRDEKTPYIFVIEFSNERLADAICEATSAEKLRFHSCHNVTKDEFNTGVTYLSLMQQNLQNLRKALS